MTTRFIRSVAALAVPICLAVPARAQDTRAILKEIQKIKQDYQARIAGLEARLKELAEKQKNQAVQAAPAPSPAQTSSASAFNPSIGLVLSGRASTFSRGTSELPGFGIGEEGERGKEGLAVNESELNFSANADDKFYGSVTASIVSEGGEDKIELEEAFIQTLPGMGLPEGARIKAGRALWTFGYLNEHHTHTDDFTDRPLPYRVYLNNAFNDDGMQVSYILPTDFYSEIGGGAYRGDDFPAGGSNSGLGAWSGFARIGGDIGDNQSWRIGASFLGSDVNSRSTNGGMVTFVGQSRLYAADLRYTWAPTGNPTESEVTLQAEYLRRDEDGTYNDADAGTGNVAFDGSSSGWYAQGVYKFARAWRAGVRYARMESPKVPGGLAGSALDSNGHDPSTIAVMGDWTNSEFGRIRLQYNREDLTSDSADNQFILQYIISIGAHGAHVY